MARTGPARGRVEPRARWAVSDDAMTSRTKRTVFLALAALLLAGCSGVSPLADPFADPPPRERYAESLREAGLERTALGRAWTAAGERALLRAPRVDAPYRETGYMPPEAPDAAGYRLGLQRGQRLVVDVEMRSAEPGRVFLELFRVPPGADSVAQARYVAGSATDTTRLAHGVEEDGEYVVRFQPELLRGGRYEITLRVEPSLAFPVEGADNRDVGSRWGAPRDAGSRAHRGVDIFAPRGTPALAAADGRVRRAGTNRLGGNVVWLGDHDGGRSYYYAHLDRRTVRDGDRVARGDTVGLVGNTGNARTTPPHLHFGIRAAGFGWVDPYAYIARTPSDPPALAVDTAVLGGWIRTRGSVNLRSGPGTDTEVERTLPARTVARAVAGTSDWLRVELPDRTTGFLAARLTDPIGRPVASFRADESRLVRDAPSAAAAALDSVAAGEAAPVLGSYGDWLLVRVGERRGWVAERAAGG